MKVTVKGEEIGRIEMKHRGVAAKFKWIPKSVKQNEPKVILRLEFGDSAEIEELIKSLKTYLYAVRNFTGEIEPESFSYFPE